jgi:hypothetical protein
LEAKVRWSSSIKKIFRWYQGLSVFVCFTEKLALAGAPVDDKYYKPSPISSEEKNKSSLHHDFPWISAHLQLQVKN